jgi:very-short-patch-repair endonuclease
VSWSTITDVIDLPDPDWYLEHVLVHAVPGVDRLEVGPIAAWDEWWQGQAHGDGRLLALARGQGFVVKTSQLHAAGWSDHDLRREVRRRNWWVPARGTASPVVVSGDDFAARRRRHAIVAAAAALVRPEHLVTGVSAAIMRGLPSMRIPARPDLTSPTDDWMGRRAASRLRHAGITPADRSNWFGAACTTIPRTLVDLGRHDARSALMAADAALREQRTTHADLNAALLRARGWPGVRRAREVVSLADDAAESPLESVVRLALHDDGFPAPRLQQIVAGYRVDFLWPEYRLILEADGREKYRDDELWREKKRELALLRAGYEVERIMWADVIRGWPAMSRRLWARIRR